MEAKGGTKPKIFSIHFCPFASIHKDSWQVYSFILISFKLILLKILHYSSLLDLPVSFTKFTLTNNDNNFLFGTVTFFYYFVVPQAMV